MKKYLYIIKTKFGYGAVIFDKNGVYSIDIAKNITDVKKLAEERSDFILSINQPTWMSELIDSINNLKNIFEINIPFVYDFTPFQEKCYKALCNVKKGDVISYKELGKIIDNENAYRAVGTALSKNPFAIIIPCHRVGDTHYK